MKIVETTFERLPRERLEIGFEGENLRATVRIDCTSVFAEYPNATPSLIVKPLFADAYPVVVDRNGTDVDWLITSEILSFSGDGEIQLVFYKGEVICKSAVSKIRVSRSLQVTGEMPDPVVQWVENANRKLAEVDAQIVELEGMVTTATDAAERAEQSASTASTKAEQAAGSAATATEKATEATNAAGTATAKAAQAALSATQAINSAVSAADSESGATAKAAEAAQSAQIAAQKAEQITEAAQTATGKAEEASASATAAHESEINAAESADDALSAEVGANAAKRAAETSATQASISEQNAGTAAQTATQKAAEATQSATDAETFAGTATTKAEEAAASAQAAQEAQTAVEQTAEQLADSLEQIAQNTQDIAELDERKANIDGYYPDMTVGNAEQLNSSKFVENSEPYTLRTSGGTSDIGNREYLDAVVGGTVAWNQMVRDEASENNTDFADVVTVTDAVEDATGVRVKLEPVQDLHGYDHPWPAGGGKNLWGDIVMANDMARTVGASVNTTNKTVSIVAGSGSPEVNMTEGIVFKENTQYTFIFDGTVAVYGNLMFVYTDGTNDRGLNRYFTVGANVSAPGKTVAGLYKRSYSGTTTIYYEKAGLFEGALTASQFSPYSNICPITGWDGVKVTRTGKNLLGGLDLARAFGRAAYPPQFSIDTTTKTFKFTRVDFFDDHYIGTIFTPKNKARMTVFVTYSSTAYNNSIRIIYTDGTYTALDLNSTNGEKTTYRLVTSENKQVESITLQYYSNGQVMVYYDESGVFEGIVASEDFVPYAGQTYDITLPTEAGTVYGGELTVNADGSGSLVVDRAEVDLGTLNWTYNSANNRFDGPSISSSKKWENNSVTANAVCECLKTVSFNDLFQGADNAIAFDAKLLRARSTAFGTDVNAFKTTMSGVKLVYELQTPITYSLTASQIRTLLGTNNVWSDAGQTALTYTGTDEHLTLESGKKYLARLSGTDSMLLGSGQEITAVKGTDNVFDLTQMFGTAVADYVYQQGAAFFRKWFPNAVYQYNAGELRHIEGLSAHEMVGFNQWDEEWEVGAYSSADGTKAALKDRIRSKNFIPVFPSTNYYKTVGLQVYYYDHEKNFISWSSLGVAGVLTTPTNCYFMTFNGLANSGTTYKHDICINLAHNNSRNGEYAPYEKHSYPLDSSVILRGIPKVGANGVYWDGDRYLPDGTVERKYGVVDLGTLNWAYVPNSAINFRSYEDLGAKPAASAVAVPNAICPALQVIDYTSLSQGTDGITVIFAQSAQAGRIWACNTSYTDAASFKAAMSGVLLVYELATPTYETAQPYHSTQWVSDWGTEEFVSTGIVPVGHETRYPANLRDKLQHLPDAASGNGSYLITQTDGQMVLTPFPAPPSTAGNYVLKATVVNGVATYTWEVAT